MDNEKRTERDDLIIGRNAVSEALKSGRAIDTLLVAKGERNGSIGQILAKCRDLGVVIKEVDRKKLDMMCNSSTHQGVAAYAASHEYASMEDVFALAEERGEKPFIIICDELEDPHNLGAILRTAEATGVHGVIIPKRRNASLSYVVGKASAGAVEYVPVVRVANLAQTMDELKEEEFGSTAQTWTERPGAALIMTAESDLLSVRRERASVDLLKRNAISLCLCR